MRYAAGSNDLQRRAHCGKISHVAIHKLADELEFPCLKDLRLGTARFSIILEEYSAESQLSVKREQRTAIVRAKVREP
jgi:hypothetical protein